MEKRYQPEKYEQEIYQNWESSDFFNPDKLPGKREKRYSISIPPPNITGSLHMGHALNGSIQDVLIRYHRLKGGKTLWLPGTDHAGIATQNVVEKKLAKENITRQQLGQKKFTERVWEWREKSGDQILEQLKKLGCSCDWSRTRFTLDDDYIKAVQKSFLHYWKKGYIYRGPRIVNWCPRCSTAISDIEVKYQEKKGKLWYIKYPIKDNPKQYITIATTRPETMLGDTAVAVNPKDKRYQKLIGKTLILPLIEREIPIIAHRLVDLEFGTGALKITPAHDNTDWKIGEDAGLEIINVIGPDAKMTELAGEFKGLGVLEARKQIIIKLKEQELLDKEEDYLHQISLCDRCSTPIEPQISTQWFVKMKELALPAIKAVESGKVEILPARYKKIYLNWLKNVKDWCISRQLWWGHQLPVWFCQNNENQDNNPKDNNNNQEECFVASVEKPKKCPKCGATEFKQSEDVLDTWFSSALWPFATMGWPKETNDLKEYYPTDFLCTAGEILYLWVARMIFSSLEFLDKIPFKQAYIHSTILATDGRRMSKSLGNGIDPLELIEKYGADATRFGLLSQTNRDQQAIRFDERNILAARNFMNKLWNVCRFIDSRLEQDFDTEIDAVKPITLADQWILSRLNKLIQSVEDQINIYEFGHPCQQIYDFAWHELADWYLEISKYQLDNNKTKENTLKILQYIVAQLLKTLHPFAPFITEKIWQSFKGEKALMITSWPIGSEKLIQDEIEKEFKRIQDLIVEIRNWKNEKEIPLKEEKKYKTKNIILEKNENKQLVEQLGNVKIIEK